MLDRVLIFVGGGNGGNGCISFRHEKFVPRGGPDGGRGGDGGSVFFVATDAIDSLGFFRRNRRIIAERGQHGKGKRKNGAKGQDKTIEVPTGTEITVLDEEGEITKKVDLVEQGQTVKVARGGEGGKGNTEFAGPQNREPRLAQTGEEGEKKTTLIEMKRVADVGLVGKPNAGKSSLLKRISRAKPHVAAYPFTTVEPVVGVVEQGYEVFTAVEIPGLLEGAHKGVGLGLDFLRHIERTRALVLVVDGTEPDIREAVESLKAEMAAYGKGLTEKPYVIAVNKQDKEEAKDIKGREEKAIEQDGAEVFWTSAKSGEGVDELMAGMKDVIDKAEKGWAESQTKRRDEGGQPQRTRRAPQAKVVRSQGRFHVNSRAAARLMGITDLRDWRVRVQLQREFGRLGITHALEEAGIRAGHTVVVGNKEIVWE